MRAARSLRRWPNTGRRSNSGFTMVELLVVLAILGLLAGLVAPQVIGYLGGASAKAARIQLNNIEAGLDLYRLDAGRYPDSLEGLITKPQGADRWNGPYLKKDSGIVDPWGRPYAYKFPGEHGEYDLYSLAADNAEGGDGEDADVRSW